MAAPKSAIPSFMGWSIPSDKIVSSQPHLAIFASKLYALTDASSLDC